jgi:hypothetical protein
MRLIAHLSLLALASATAGAQTLPPFVQLQVSDPVRGQELVVCYALGGISYGWRAPTGYTLAAQCATDEEAIFHNGFDGESAP